MSKPQHPTSRELKQKAIGDLYSPESREADLNMTVRRAVIESTRDRNWMVTKTRKRSGWQSGASGHLTEHIAAIIEDGVRTITQLVTANPTIEAHLAEEGLAVDHAALAAATA